MANQSSIILAKESKIATGLSKGLGFSKKDDSLELKKMDLIRILGSETIDANQDHKRRYFEKLVVLRERILTQQNVDDVKCALEAEVIDDTALIETTAAVTGFKNCYRNETDVGYGKHPVVSRNQKQENDGKKKRNKGFKKQGGRCSMKCLNEKKSNSQGVEDKNTTEKISEGKGHKVYRKMPAKVKYVYQRTDTKNVEEHQKVENLNELEKISGEANQETDVNLEAELVETEVNEKDDGLKLNPIIAVHTKNSEAEDENVLGSKKIVYSREKIEALGSVDEEGQKSKWIEVYSAFAPAVAREYTGLVVDAKNRPTQRYTRVVNFGSTRHANAILSMPPVLPLCSPSNCI